MPRTMADELLDLVKETNGIKDRDLVSAYRKFYYQNHIKDSDIYTQIESLIKEHKLTAIEYSIDYTNVRNFLLPAKTSYIIRGVKEPIHRI